MKPSLAHFLVQCFTQPGQTLLDPFAGAGTIPFEAALSGRRAVAFDISTLAYAVTCGKLIPPRKGNLEALLGELETFIADYHPDPSDLRAASDVRFNRPIPEYFHERTLKEIIAARQFFLRYPQKSPEWSFALACMLHILHGNRPYALSRRSHPITPFAPTGPVNYASVVKKLREKVRRALEVELPATFIRRKCYINDVLDTWPKGLEEIDAIITSPPFFDSTRFYMTNWMRYWFCGWSRSDFDTEPQRFIESLQKKSMAIYGDVFRRFKQHLKPSGVIVLHLGRSGKCDMAAEVARIAMEHFQLHETFRENVQHCETHGVRDKGAVVEHQYIVLSNR